MSKVSKFHILLFLLIPILGFSFSSSDKKISLSGYYQNKNLFIQNPTASDGFGFTIKNININGEIYAGTLNKKSIELDFGNLNIKKGEEIEVLIVYQGPKPVIMNPHSILPESTCNYKSISNNGKTIHFKTVNEEGSLNFHIQHYRWNKWIGVGQIKGKGTPSIHSYEYKVIPNTGDNLYRVVQLKSDGSLNASKVISIKGQQESVKYKRNSNKITFTRATFFEVHDMYGNLLKKGFGDQILLNIDADKALYLSYDNTTELVENQ